MAVTITGLKREVLRMKPGETETFGLFKKPVKMERESVEREVSEGRSETVRFQWLGTSVKVTVTN